MDSESICIPETIISYFSLNKNNNFKNLISNDLSDLHELIHNENTNSEFMGILGLIMFIFIYVKFQKRNSLFQKIMSISWLIIGYKFYLGNSINKIFTLNEGAQFILGLINLLTGIIIYINFIEISKLITNWSSNTLWQNLKLIVNFIFLNLSNGIYDIEKIMLPMLNNNEIYIYKLILNYLFVALNTFPLLSNTFIKKNFFNVPFNMFPSPVALATLTIFINYFKNVELIPTKQFFIIDVLCYSFLILNFINDVFYLKLITAENIFFLILNILNLISVYYLDIFNLYKVKKISNYKFY